MSGMMVLLGMMEVPKWMANEPKSSYELLMIGGALLILAAVLMGLRRKTRITLESSVVTEEMMIYLSRIANAVERPQGPSMEQVTVEVLKRLEEMAKAKPNGKVREIPNSMFGREYRKDD